MCHKGLYIFTIKIYRWEIFEREITNLFFPSELCESNGIWFLDISTSLEVKWTGTGHKWGQPIFGKDLLGPPVCISTIFLMVLWNALQKAPSAISSRATRPLVSYDNFYVLNSIYERGPYVPIAPFFSIFFMLPWCVTSGSMYIFTIKIYRWEIFEREALAILSISLAKLSETVQYHFLAYRKCL